MTNVLPSEPRYPSTADDVRRRRDNDSNFEAESRASRKGLGLGCNGEGNKAQRAVFAWGEGEDGQLGIATVPIKKSNDGTETYLSSPTWIAPLQEVRLRGRVFGRSPVVGGSRNSMALTDSGELYTWGWNQRGSLGLGHKQIERVPRKVDALSGLKITQAAVGGWHCLALSEAGQVWAWGGNEYSQCALTSDARAGAERDVCVPVQILPSLRIRQVAAGGMHSLALTEDGGVWAWGQPLCDFKNVQQRLPAPVMLTSASKVTKVAAGAFHNMAMQEDGVLLSWGRNEYGSLGLGNTTFMTKPEPVTFFLEKGLQVKDMNCGGWHSTAITSDGEVYVWGRGEYGRLGLGADCSARLLPTHLVLPNEEKALQVSCGGTHTVFLTTSKRVMTCGRGSFGRQAREDLMDCNTPVYVQFEGGPWSVLSVSAGGRHSIAVAELKNRRASISKANLLSSSGHFMPVVEENGEVNAEDSACALPADDDPQNLLPEIGVE